MPVFPTADYRLHYQWGAEFDPRRGTVVLLHDGLGAVGSWRGLPQLLSEALQVNTLVYDRWGYGQSEPRAVFQSRFMEAEVPVLAALLAHLGVERPCLLGHSDGGSIALLFAAWHPEQVTAVITEAAHTFVEPETQAGIRDLVALQAAGSTPRWLHKLHGPRAESLLRAWSAHWLSDVHARWDIRGELARRALPGAGDSRGCRRVRNPGPGGFHPEPRGRRGALDRPRVRPHPPHGGGVRISGPGMRVPGAPPAGARGSRRGEGGRAWRRRVRRCGLSRAAGMGSPGRRVPLPTRGYTARDGRQRRGSRHPRAFCVEV